MDDMQVVEGAKARDTIEGTYPADVAGMTKYLKFDRAANDQVIEIRKNGEVVRTLIFLPNGLRLIDLDLDEGEMWPQSTVEQNPKVTFKIDSQDTLDYMNSFYYGAPSTSAYSANPTSHGADFWHSQNSPGPVCKMSRTSASGSLPNDHTPPLEAPPYQTECTTSARIHQDCRHF